MPIRGIHHINFLVRDLEEAVRRYSELFGLENFIIEPLASRGVLTARVALGNQWLVLVQPVDSDGLPARHLAKHGEGFFLMSLAVDDLSSAVARVKLAGGEMTSDTPRAGLLEWQIQDVAADHVFGAFVQLCQDENY